MTTKTLLFTLVAVGYLVTNSAVCQGAALLSGPGPGAAFTNAVGIPTQLIGFEFTVGATSIVVTQLGIYDLNSNGIGSAQQVRLWTSSGTLIAEVSVPAGTAGLLSGEFRYADLTASVLLNSGQTYIIGMTNANEAYRSNSVSQMIPLVAPQVTFVQGRRNLNGGDFAGFVADPNTRIGPNLTFTVVPEPSSLTLFIAGAVSLAGIGLRHRRELRSR